MQDHPREQAGTEVHWRDRFLEEWYSRVHPGDICKWNEEFSTEQALIVDHRYYRIRDYACDRVSYRC
jgi:hypothetical protein